MTSWRHSLVLIMKKAAQQILRFKGFLSPRYTQVPDELFDELMAYLSGAELKVLLYIIRRTFGFKGIGYPPKPGQFVVDRVL
jgi:hypothetical protein